MEQQNPPRDAFGVHLTLDGYGCSSEKLTDLEAIYCFLDKCPDLIGMTKIMPPYVFRYQGKVPEDWGLSGFVLIAESHISIHTFPEKNYLSIDIFSCKGFTAEIAVGFSVELFGISKKEVRVFDRGLEFPRNVKTVRDIMEKERTGICSRGNR